MRGRYNIAPTTWIDVVRLNKEGQRELISMRWGLIPVWWKKSLKEMPATFNARVETVAEKHMFRDAYKKRRCIVPASGFYECTGDKKARQPHLFTSSDGAPILALAGLWDSRWDPSNGEEILSCTLIVTEASEWMTPYHDRMPAVLAQAEIAGSEARWKRANCILRESEYMVSSRLNRTGVGDDDPTVIEPAEAGL